MSENYKQWILKADEDIQTCEILLKQDFFSCSIVCFHSQQAAEKYLKAFLTANDIEFPKVHDIVHLLDNFCLPANEDLLQIREPVILLSDYAVLPRYPGNFGSIDVSTADEAFQAVSKIKEVVLNLMTEKNNQ